MVDEAIESKSHSGCYAAEISRFQTNHCSRRWKRNQQMGRKSRHGTTVLSMGCVTDAETMELAEMVLGKVNKALFNGAARCKSHWYQWKRWRTSESRQEAADGEDIGFVGDVKEVNADIIYDLLEKDFLPIIAPIGLDDDYNMQHINADDAACAIAKAINAEKLAFLTDIEGVYKDPERSVHIDF